MLNVNTQLPTHIIKAMATKEGRSAMRKEYTRLRAIAQKRLKRMEKASTRKGAKTDWRKTEAYKQYNGTVPKLKGMNDQHFPYELAKLSRWVSSEKSQLKKLKEAQNKALETLHKHGYNIIEEDFQDFTDFMEDWRAQKYDEIYDSEQAAEVYWRAKEKKRDPAEVLDKFYQWKEENKASAQQAMEKVEKLPKLKKAKKKSKKLTARQRWNAIKKKL